MNLTPGKSQQKRQTLAHSHEEIKEDPLEDQEPTIDEEQDDDLLNEQLFQMYDKLFNNYNSFGSMFQQTAHQIGLLIRKNMVLNQRVEDLEDELRAVREQNKAREAAYESIKQGIEEKDKQRDELVNDNVGLRLQLEQFMPSEMLFQRDSFKERERKTAAMASATKLKAAPQLIDNKSKKDKLQSQKQQIQQKSPDHKGVEGGTFESFFEIGKASKQGKDQFDESCSLKDLFSQGNSKKRNHRQLEVAEEDCRDQWISNKRKQKRQFNEGSQIADRFDQLSQAFYSINKEGNFQSSFPKRDSLGGSLSSPSVQILKEDSCSAASVINAGIRFDPQQVQSNLKQTKLTFNANSKKGDDNDKKDKKQYEIKIVDQVTESQLDDFFAVKNERKSNRASNNSRQVTSAGSHTNNKSGSSKTKLAYK